MANTSRTSGMRRRRASDITTTKQFLTDDIRLRAYALYELRGREDGHAFEDWVEAEREVTERRALAAKKAGS